MKKRILCLWLPRWPIQRRIVAQPPLSGQPIVLHARDARRGECVAACSTAALRQGVRVGMPLAEAISLLEEKRKVESGKRKKEERKLETLSSGFPLSAFGFASSAFLPHQPEADRAALWRLAAWCEQFSPCVGLEHHPEPQSLLLDVTGLGPLFGGEESLAWRVIEAFARRGYAVRAAIADTVGAAWAMSRYGADPRVGVRASARLPQPPGDAPAMDPSAPRIVPPGEQAAALAPLAVEALRLPAPTLTALHQLGVFQIGQVLELPRASLASRFQHEGRCALIERLDQAFGAVEELIAPHRPPPEFRAEFCWEHPVASLWDVQKILERLFASLCRELAARGQGALRATCRLNCEGGEVRKLSLGVFQPTVSAKRLLELAVVQLERLRLPGGVGRVRVEIELSAPLTVQQQAFFAEQARARPRELALLIDRLSSRIGPERVVRPRLLPDAQPERAFCEAALVGREKEKPKAESQKRTKKEKKLVSLSFGFPPPAFRFRLSAFPLRLWLRPIPIDVVALADGPPASFRVGRRRFRIHAWWGPERIETAWWRGRSIRRDYYQVETTAAARYWLFRNLHNRSWFLHGEYR